MIIDTSNMLHLTEEQIAAAVSNYVKQFRQEEIEEVYLGCKPVAVGSGEYTFFAKVEFKNAVDKG